MIPTAVASKPRPRDAPPLSSDVPKTTKEIGAQTDDNCLVDKQDSSTQTKNQWLQISLNSPPLSLTQEVPDVAL